MHTMKRLLLGAGLLALSAGAAAAAPAVVASSVNLRDGPGTQFAVIGVLPAGATVDVNGCGAVWCQVAFAGEEGYASRAFLDLGTAAVEPYPYYSYDYGPDYYYDYGYYGPSFAFGYGFDHGRRFRHHRFDHHFAGPQTGPIVRGGRNVQTGANLNARPMGPSTVGAGAPMARGTVGAGGPVGGGGRMGGGGGFAGPAGGSAHAGAGPGHR